MTGPPNEKGPAASETRTGPLTCSLGNENGFYPKLTCNGAQAENQRPATRRRRPSWLPPLLKLPASEPVWLRGTIERVLRDHCKLGWSVVSAGRHTWPQVLLLSPNGDLHFLALEHEAALSSDQREFVAYCLALDVYFASARTVAEAIAALRRWGCIAWLMPRQRRVPPLACLRRWRQ